MEALFESLKNSPSIWISVFALLLTMHQAWATRKHNRLCVQPILTTHLRIEHDAAGGKITRVIATLSNCGLGPAIVKSFEILVNNKPFVVSHADEILSLVAQNVTAHIVQSSAGVLRKNHIFSKDTIIELLNLEIWNATPFHLEEINLFHVRVTYESAYGESFSYDSRTHFF